MKVIGALPFGKRILIQLDLPKDHLMVPIYLHEAAGLRLDLKLPGRQ